MPGSAVAITALTALADYARGDKAIDAITERLGVELTPAQNTQARAALAGAAHTLTSHLTSREIDRARETVQDDAWAATVAEVNE